MKQFVIAAFLLLAINTSAFSFFFNPFWTHQDKKAIKALVKLNKDAPEEIEQHFIRLNGNKKIEKENLGFGWSMWGSSSGCGYVCVSAKFYYYHDTLISYSLSPDLPEEKGLRRRYKKWYNNFFHYTGNKIQDHRFNETAILRPLKEFDGDWKTLPDSILEYMSPASGISYGWNNGETFHAMRKRFDSVQLKTMMYSINPSIRFHAIELYLLQRRCITKDEPVYEWIKKNLKEFPVVPVQYGCFVHQEKASDHFMPFLYLALEEETLYDFLREQ